MLILEIAAGIVLGWFIITNFKVLFGISMALLGCSLVLGVLGLAGYLIYIYWQKIGPLLMAFGIIFLFIVAVGIAEEVWKSYARKSNPPEA